MIKARLAVFAVLSIALSLCEPAYACRGPSGQPSKSLRTIADDSAAGDVTQIINPLWSGTVVGY